MNTEFALQAYSGLFQFLPLGLRVQEKVEKLLDNHMLKLGSSDFHCVQMPEVPTYL